MSPILVLAPERDGAPLRERQVVDLYRTLPPSLDDYSWVLVVDDGGAGAVRRLLEALRCHDGFRGAQIGVVSFVSVAAQQPSEEGCRESRSGGVPHQDRPVSLRIGVAGEVPTIEYQLV